VLCKQVTVLSAVPRMATLLGGRFWITGYWTW